MCCSRLWQFGNAPGSLGVIGPKFQSGPLGAAFPKFFAGASTSLAAKSFLLGRGKRGLGVLKVQIGTIGMFRGTKAWGKSLKNIGNANWDWRF